MNKPSWISPHEVLQSWLINKVKWRIIRGRVRGLKERGGLLIFFPWRWGGEELIREGRLKETGLQFSACSLIKLLFSNLLLILSGNNPIHMYLGDFRVYFKVEVYFRVTWSRFRKNLWIMLTLPMLNLLLTRRFYSMVDEFTVICT